jgi:hypothetical protein
MSESITSVSPPTGWRGAVVRAGLAALRVSLKVSSGPMVWVIRRPFAETDKQPAASLRVQAPAECRP